jgi:hypothetical protein
LLSFCLNFTDSTYSSCHCFLFLLDLIFSFSYNFLIY